MHVTDEELKALIDCVAMRVDDEMDTLGDDLDVKRVLDDRDDVRILWGLTDLLEKLRQEQRSRRRGFKTTNEGSLQDPPEGAKNVAIGVEQGHFEATPDVKALFERMFRPPVVNPLAGTHLVSSRTILGLVKKVSELEKGLGAAQATIGDLLAQANDHREQLDSFRSDFVRIGTRIATVEQKVELLKATMKARSGIRSRIENGRYAEFEELRRRVNALDDRFPDTKFWGRVQNFERELEKRVNSWVAECNAVMEERTRNGELSAEALLRLTRVTEGLHEKLQALELQGDDRWVRTQRGTMAVQRMVNEVKSKLEEHVGEGEVQH